MRSITKLRAAALAACATAFAVAPAGVAGAAPVELDPCDDAPLSQPFAQWNDDDLYKLVPGGDIEGSLEGWTLARGAERVDGSEPYAVTGTLGASSIELPPGASVTTAATCVNAGAPTYRFFSRAEGGFLGVLPVMKVELLYQEGPLKRVVLPLGTTLPSRGWRPSLVLPTAAAVAALLNDGEAPLRLRFTAVSGTWQIDDVFVDPYRRV